MIIDPIVEANYYNPHLGVYGKKDKIERFLSVNVLLTITENTDSQHYMVRAVTTL